MGQEEKFLKQLEKVKEEIVKLSNITDNKYYIEFNLCDKGNDYNFKWNTAKRHKI